MQQLYLGLAVIGAIVLLLGLVTRVIHGRLPLSLPLVSLLVGVALGPGALDALNPQQWGPLDTILGEAARLTLAIGLMATALRLPPRYFLVHWRTQAMLLGVLMPLMWVAASLLVYVWLALPLGLAFLIGAIMTPTDPIVASAIVTSDFAETRLPARVRHALSAESGANDGLATACVMLSAFLLVHDSPAGIREWITATLLHEILGGVLVGTLIGAAAGWMLTWSERHHSIEVPSFLAYTIALALLILGVAELLGASGILAVFVGGLAFDNLVGGRERAEEAKIQEAVNQFFTLPVFILIGLVIPLMQWIDLGWRGLGLVASVLLLRRLPALLSLRRGIPALKPRADAMFAGWFGPIGVSALLYVVEAMQHTDDNVVWTVSSLAICASVAAHGVTATPFIRWYSTVARQTHADEADGTKSRKGARTADEKKPTGKRRAKRG